MGHGRVLKALVLALLAVAGWAQPAAAAETTLTAKLPRAKTAVTWWFEYGTKRLDHKTPKRRLRAHRRAAAVKAPLRNLRPATAYRYRLCTRVGKHKPKGTTPRRLRTAAPAAPITLPPAPGGPAPAPARAPAASPTPVPTPGATATPTPAPAGDL